MAVESSGPVSRRRPNNGSAVANEIGKNNRSGSSSPKNHKRGQVGGLSLGKLRLRCLTGAERRGRKKTALGKVAAVAAYSAALLVLGSISGGGGGGGGLIGGLVGHPLLAFGTWAQHEPAMRRDIPRSVAFTDGAGGYDTTAFSFGRGRDARLIPLDRSAFGSTYGGLRIRRLGPEGQKRGRVIGPPDPDDAAADSPLPLHPRTWTDEPYDPFDDDGVRSAVFRDFNKETRKCQRAPWHKFHRPTCNDFHAVDVLGGVMGDDVRYLGRGHFRQAFAMKGHAPEPDTTLKVLRWRSGQDDYVGRIEKTRMDALVMERLTASRRVTNVHGHCSTSIVVESLPGEIWDVVVPTGRVTNKKDLNDRKDVDNKNGMSPTEKLQLALDVSEALSELHGFKDGVIVHDDIDLGQFLRTPDGKVKINDFNRAKPMLWDPVEQKYCKYYNGHIGGKMRSPQEFTEPPGILDESMDVYSMCNNFYGILTGLWPFYLYEDDVAQRKMVKGERPYIDERWKKHSFAERKLIEVIEGCWIHDPAKRVDIFWVVNVLREAVAENARLLGEGATAQTRHRV